MRGWEWPPADSRLSGTEDLSPTTTKNRILPQPPELGTGPQAPEENMVQAIPWFWPEIENPAAPGPDF